MRSSTLICIRWKLTGRIEIFNNLGKLYSEYSTNTPVKCKHTYHKGKSWLVYSTDDTNI